MHIKRLAFTAAIIAAAPMPALAQQLAAARILDAPTAEVFLSHHEYRPFDKAAVQFKAAPGSYVLLLRVADDGYKVRGTNTVEILYPTLSTQQTPLHQQTDFLETQFEVKGGPGTNGVVYAISSARPFDLSRTKPRFRWLPSIDTRFRVDIASRVVEKLGIQPQDILGVSVAVYDVSGKYGKANLAPHNENEDFSTDLFRRCEQRSKDAWCRSLASR
jgi:hypothetical protein